MHKLLSLARDLIHNADKHRHVSFILYKSNIISIGYSQSHKTDPLANKYGYRFNSIHSELQAIKRFPFPPSKLTRCTIVNVRVMANGNFGMSKPCINCQKLLKDFGLRTVYYTNRQGNLTKWSIEL